MSNFQWRPVTEEDRSWQPLTEETKLLPTSSLPSILSSSSVSQLLFPSLWLTSVSHWSGSPFPSHQRSHCEPFLLIPIHLMLGTGPDTIPFSKGAPWGAASWQAPSTGKNDLPLKTDAPDGQSEVYGFPARGFTKPCQFPFCHWPIPFHWLSLPVICFVSQIPFHFSQLHLGLRPRKACQEDSWRMKFYDSSTTIPRGTICSSPPNVSEEGVHSHVLRRACLPKHQMNNSTPIIFKQEWKLKDVTKRWK